MKNLEKWFGIIALVVIIGFSFVACDTGDNDNTGGNGEGKTVTFSLNKIDSRTFTVTVDGAKWERNFIDVNALLVESYFNPVTSFVTTVDIRWSIIQKPSDSVLKCTLGSTFQTVRTISFKTNINGSSVTDGGSSVNYVVNKARSSVTFP